MERLNWPQVMEMFARVDALYLEKCREANALRARLGMLAGQRDAAEVTDAEKLAYTE